jgi:membrane-associated protease RseP (regulator of RpoE activity)
MSQDWTSFNQMNEDHRSDLDLLKSEVGQRFPFYDMKYDRNMLAFFCRIDEYLLEENFDSLRLSLSEKGYIPMLRYTKGEHILYVIRKQKKKVKPVWINIALLIATIITTTLAGSIQWVGISNGDIIEIISIDYLLDGLLFFSIPLLLILGIHEMGHYFTSKKHKVDSSLPYFIPLPPPFILGTFGALIATREPIPNRKALIDIGAAGPICGFLVAIPVSILGFYFMQQNPIHPIADSEGFVLIYPLFLQWLSNFFPMPQDIIIHPTAFAGWVGLFITALNLLPIGQLDGGHVLRALFKENSKYITWLVMIALIIWGFYVSVTTNYAGWIVFLLFIMFLMGTRHPAPLNEISPIDTKRKIIGIVALFIFILCFAPIPISS